MNKNEINKALLGLNEEYCQIFNSKEYNLGRRIYKYIEIFRNADISEIKKRVFIERQLKKAKTCGAIKKDKQYYANGKLIDDNLVGVVYSCITGGYDSIKIPCIKPDNCDYVFFTDKNQDKNEYYPWQVEKIPDEAVLLHGNLKNRFCKLNPYKLFHEYDYSVYIDGNVRVIGDITFLYEVARKARIGIAMHEHPIRECLYDEADACIALNRGNKEKIRNQIQKYQQEGFPRKYGLFEATVIVVDHHNQLAQKILEQWWDEYVLSESQRDQLSFPYILWKNGYSKDDVGTLGTNKKLNPMFRIDDHLP